MDTGKSPNLKITLVESQHKYAIKSKLNIRQYSLLGCQNIAYSHFKRGVVINHER
jgi:hypothetical protein